MYLTYPYFMMLTGSGILFKAMPSQSTEAEKFTLGEIRMYILITFTENPQTRRMKLESRDDFNRDDIQNLQCTSSKKSRSYRY